MFNEEVIVINHEGLSGGGDATLGLEMPYILNCYAYFNANKGNQKYKRSFYKDSNIKFYNDVSQLEQLNPKVVLFNIWSPPKNKKELDDINRLLNTFKDSYLIYIDCRRKTTKNTLYKYIRETVDGKFNEIIGFTSALRKDYRKTKFTVIDINVFHSLSPVEPIPIKNRRNTIFGASRYQGFKHISQYIESITSIVPNSDFLFYYEGFSYKYNREGTKISGEPGIISTLCNSLNDKTSKENIIIHHDLFAENTLKKHNLNIYPNYFHEDRLKDWPKDFLFVCPTLGASNQKNLPQEFKRVGRNLLYWKNAVEYTNIEKIMIGVPVIFSFDYLNNYSGNEFDELIKNKYYYDYYEDIPRIAEKLKKEPNEYFKFLELEQKAILTIQDRVNQNFKKFIFDKIQSL